MRNIMMALSPFLAAIAFSGTLELSSIDGQAAKKGQKAPAIGTVVTLTKRKGDGPYGNSAYSFRYESQDLAVHKNDVDLVYSGCGLLHISPQVGLKNRIAKVTGTAITDALNFPNSGWQKTCVEPEKDGVYIMEIDDGTAHLRVRIHISSVSDSELQFEWTPFRDVAKAQSGTMGACTGKHGCN